jgi:hypothetical protein
MVVGLALQAIGIAWVALIATPGVNYLELGAALTVAGVGISMVFPTVSNAVMSSVPLSEAGVASGTNSALRELGGVFGIAVLASVFARQDVYASSTAFIDGFTRALWVGAAFSSVGVIAALLVPGRRRVIRGEASLALSPQLATAPD